MRHTTAGVSGVPQMPDGQVSATLADAWFDASRNARIGRLVRRIDRLRHKADERLATARSELDEGLQDHPLEERLRSRLLQSFERECAELSRVFQRVHTRLSLFAPARSQAQFEDGMALQLEDLQAEHVASAEPALRTEPRVPQIPFGYWMSEESFNRLQRACSAAMLLSSMGEGIGESMAVSFDAVAASAQYVHEDLAAVLEDATHSSKLAGDDEQG